MIGCPVVIVACDSLEPIGVGERKGTVGAGDLDADEIEVIAQLELAGRHERVADSIYALGTACVVREQDVPRRRARYLELAVLDVQILSLIHI